MPDFPEKLSQRMQKYCREVPSLLHTHVFLDNLIYFLFPLASENKQVNLSHIQSEWQRLQCLFIDLISSLKPRLKEPVDVLTKRFFEIVPAIHEQLLEEAEIFARNDPAANCPEEIILCYPGFYAITVYRLANELYQMQIPILPRTMSEHAHSRTGIDIHPGATIGKNFYIDHGTGTVIGETTQIGDNVKLYQGVTLGAMYVEKNLQHTKRHPTIEDNVIIYAGSTILGGDTVIGHDTIIGGNVWLTESVAPYSMVYHKAETVIRDLQNRKENTL